MTIFPRMPHLELSAVIFTSALTLVFAVMWQINEARYWKAFQVEKMLARGHPVSMETIGKALDGSYHLDESFLPGRHLHAPALLGTSLERTDKETTPGPDSFLSVIRKSARLALSRDPAVSSAWARLSYLRLVLDGPSTDVMSALKMSIYTAPCKRSLIYWRLIMAVQVHPYWDNIMASLVRSQVVLAWQDNPALLVRTAASGHFLPIIRVVLAGSTEDLNRLEALIAKYQAE